MCVPDLPHLGVHRRISTGPARTCTAGTTTFVSFSFFPPFQMCYEHARVRQEALDSTRQLMSYRSKSMKQLITGHPSKQKGLEPIALTQKWPNAEHPDFSERHHLDFVAEYSTSPENARIIPISCQLNSDNAPYTAVTQNMRSSGAEGGTQERAREGPSPHRRPTQNLPGSVSHAPQPLNQDQVQAPSPIITTSLGKECFLWALTIFLLP